MPRPSVIKQLHAVLDERQRRYLVLVVGASFVASFIELVGIGTIPAFVSLVIDPARVVSVLPESRLKNWVQGLDQFHLALYGAGTLAALYVLKNVYLSVLVYAETRLAQDVLESVSNRLFELYLRAPYTLHVQRNPAELTRNLTDEIVHAVDFLRSAMRLVREGLVLAVMFLLMVLIDPLVSSSVLLLLGAAGGGFYVLVRRALEKRGQQCQDQWTRQMQIINQSFGAIKEAKILGREPHLMQLFRHEIRGLCSNEVFYGVIACLPRYFLEVLSIAAIVPIAAGFMLLGRPIQSMLPILALFGVAAMRLVPAVTSINVALVDFRYKRPTFDLVCAELDTMTVLAAERPANGCLPSRADAIREAIELDAIWYRYPGASTDALRGVSLRIKAGESVAIVGTSGSGKTTVLDVIVGLLRPTAGRFIVDGREIQSSAPAWQRRIGYVPQAFYLIDDTIRRNIAFGLPDEQIDEVAVSRALRLAQLDEFIRTLPEGLGTIVGDRGARLSGGQRQRIAIARALYHDPSVLVMDEATSALDTETELEVIQALRVLHRDKTVIIVAHRRSTAEQCDRLIRLEEGKVVETSVPSAAQKGAA